MSTVSREAMPQRGKPAQGDITRVVETSSGNGLGDGMNLRARRRSMVRGAMQGCLQLESECPQFRLCLVASTRFSGAGHVPPVLPQHAPPIWPRHLRIRPPGIESC